MPVLMLFVAALLALPLQAGTKQDRAQRRADRQMTGTVASVEQANGMFTLRLDSGDMFSAPERRVRVVKVERVESGPMSIDSAGKGRPERRARELAVSASSLPAGTRVIVKRKVGRDGNLKRVTIRIVEK